ncbi:MAG: hypothetical protein ACLR7N_03850 [Roseburia hominis]
MDIISIPEKQIQWLTSWGCTEIYVIDRNADKIGKIEGAEIVPDIGQINGIVEICIWIMLPECDAACRHCAGIISAGGAEGALCPDDKKPATQRFSDGNDNAI